MVARTPGKGCLGDPSLRVSPQRADQRWGVSCSTALRSGYIRSSVCESLIQAHDKYFYRLIIVHLLIHVARGAVLGSGAGSSQEVHSWWYILRTLS